MAVKDGYIVWVIIMGNVLDFYSAPIVGTPLFLYSGQIAVLELNVIGVTMSLLVFSP